MPIAGKKIVGHLSYSNHYRQCKLPQNEKGCANFAQTMHLFALNQLEEVFEQPEDSLDMLALTKDNFSPQISQISNGKGVSQQNVFPLDLEHF